MIGLMDGWIGGTGSLLLLDVCVSEGLLRFLVSNSFSVATRMDGTAVKLPCVFKKPPKLISKRSLKLDAPY
jgi:hypothetical protein